MPAQQGDYIQIGRNFFLVMEVEPLYYEFRNIVAGVEIGFNSLTYPVPDLIPSKDTIHYITGIGVEGDMEFQTRYQSGSPRNTVGSQSVQRLDRVQAPYDKPFTTKFAVVSGDTLEEDINPAFADYLGAIWFYGWKFRVRSVKEIPDRVIILEDVRQHR